MSDGRQLTHDEKVTVRVSADVKRRATEAARRQGMSLSEAIRAFLRDLAKEP
jgi:antitoxin component of RelBE/YafQ-DinJ toxin-antitoxin module